VGRDLWIDFRFRPDRGGRGVVEKMCRALGASLFAEAERASRSLVDPVVMTRLDAARSGRSEDLCWVSWTELKRLSHDLGSVGGFMSLPFTLPALEMAFLHELEPLSVQFDRDECSIRVDVAAPRSAKESNSWCIPDLEEVFGQISRRLELDDPGAIMTVEILLIQ
jgi:hypothetical protein